MPRPRVCVIISAYEFPEMTKKCIDVTMENAGIEHDILLVDDGSPEPITDPRVEVFRIPENGGWTKANNKGILFCSNRYEYVCLLNNDTEPRKDFLKLMVDIMDADKSIGVASPVRVDYRDGAFMFKEYHPADIIKGTFLCSDKDDVGLDDVVNVPWLPGVALLISTMAIRYVGLFDERMRTYCSDNDYCNRMHNMGYRVVLVTKSEVTHHFGTSALKNRLLATDEQKVLLNKLSCKVNRKLFNDYPINAIDKEWGALKFDVKNA